MSMQTTTGNTGIVGAVLMLQIATASAVAVDSAAEHQSVQVLGASAVAWVPTGASYMSVDERADVEAWLAKLDDEVSEEAAVDDTAFKKVSWIPGVGLVSRQG